MDQNGIMGHAHGAHDARNVRHQHHRRPSLRHRQPLRSRGQIKIPALITYGGDTRLFYRIAAQGAAGCIPGAQLVATQGCRHLAIVQQPDAFNAVLLQFLAKAGSQLKP